MAPLSGSVLSEVVRARRSSGDAQDLLSSYRPSQRIGPPVQPRVFTRGDGRAVLAPRHSEPLRLRGNALFSSLAAGGLVTGRAAALVPSSGCPLGESSRQLFRRLSRLDSSHEPTRPPAVARPGVAGLVTIANDSRSLLTRALTPFRLRRWLRLVCCAHGGAAAREPLDGSRRGLLNRPGNRGGPLG